MGLLRIIFENLCNDQEGSLDSETLPATSGGLECYLLLQCMSIFHQG